MQVKDHYDTLKISKRATPQEIQKAFRQLVFTCHPDVAGTKGVERFRELREAYETLISNQRRQAYDAEIMAAIRSPIFTPPQPAPFRTPTPAPGHPHMARVMHQRPTSLSSYDIEAVLELSLEESIRPAIFNLDLRNDMSSPERVHQYPVAFPGRLWNRSLLVVQGLGYYDPMRHMQANLFIDIQLKHHPLFRISGMDIHHHLLISPWDIALGKAIETPTLDGWQVLKFTEEVLQTSTVRLKGRGLYGPDGKRGDFIVRFNLSIDPPPSKKARNLWSQLAKEYGRF